MCLNQNLCKTYFFLTITCCFIEITAKTACSGPIPLYPAYKTMKKKRDMEQTDHKLSIYL